MPRAPSLALLRSQSDERLARLAAEGHERAFEAIVERYRRPLFRQCRRVLTEARAEDAVQQAFLAAWTALRRGDDIVDVGAWLHRIARNSALNVARAPGFDYAELRDSLRIVEGPEEALERCAVVRQTLAGIAALPERQRQALLRSVVDGVDQDEIARDLGLSNGAVRQLVYRARASLRAAATAVLPLPLVAWVASAGVRGEPMAQRIAELVAGGASVGAAATAAKLGAVVVVAGGAVGAPSVIDGGAPLPTAARDGAPALAQPAVAAPRPAAGGEVANLAPGSEELPAGGSGGGGGAPNGAGGDGRGSRAGDNADRRSGRDRDDGGEHRRMDRNREDDEDDRGDRGGDHEPGGSGRRGDDDEVDRGGTGPHGDDSGDVGRRGAGDDDDADGGGDDPGGGDDGDDHSHAETGAGTGSAARSGSGSGTRYVRGEGDEERSAAPAGGESEN